MIKNYDYGDINIGHALICLFTGFPAHPLTGGWHWVGVWNPAYDKAWLSCDDEETHECVTMFILFTLLKVQIERRVS